MYDKKNTKISKKTKNIYNDLLKKWNSFNNKEKEWLINNINRDKEIINFNEFQKQADFYDPYHKILQNIKENNPNFKLGTNINLNEVLIINHFAEIIRDELSSKNELEIKIRNQNKYNFLFLILVFILGIFIGLYFKT